MTKTVFDLIKALLNATLLLLALCLFLGWQLFASAHDVADRLGEIGTRFVPVQTQLQRMNEEISALNLALSQSDTPDSTEMRLRLARLEEQLTGLKEETKSISELPEQVVTAAVKTAARAFSNQIAAHLPRLESCRPNSAALLH